MREIPPHRLPSMMRLHELGESFLIAFSGSGYSVESNEGLIGFGTLQDALDYEMKRIEIKAAMKKTQTWCHEAMFTKYANPDNECMDCGGDKTRELKPADEHCPECRMPCGDSCAPDSGPCCDFCRMFKSRY